MNTGAIRKVFNLAENIIEKLTEKILPELSSEPVIVGIDRQKQNNATKNETHNSLLKSPITLYAQKKAADCETKGSGGGKRKRTGVVCRQPDITQKVIPPYEYGFCKEVPKDILTSCPPKIEKAHKGPCCLTEEPPKKSGCRS